MYMLSQVVDWEHGNIAGFDDGSDIMLTEQ
jgi:hypothetical protein